MVSDKEENRSMGGGRLGGSVMDGNFRQGRFHCQGSIPGQPGENQLSVVCRKNSQLPSCSSRAGALLFGSSEEARGAGSEPGSVSERDGQAQQGQASVRIVESREGCV